MNTGRPRITIVTPSFNQGQFLDQAMRSVLDQGYPDLEYMVVDGGSSDDSAEIIRDHEDRLAWWVSEPDGDQYDALNKGFARTTGEIMGWLNADDLHLSWTLALVAEVFRIAPSVNTASPEWMSMVAYAREFPWLMKYATSPRSRASCSIATIALKES